MQSFIDHGGEYTFPPPYTTENVKFYGFILDADINALQALLDKHLNAPLRGKRRFVPVGPFVMLVALKLDHLKSTVSPYNEMGWFVEKEMATWIMVIDEVEKRMFWFINYMWVDNGYAMANGRELYGFPKQFASFEVPDSPATADAFSMEAYVFKTFGPDNAAENVNLINITKTDDVQHQFTPKAIAGDFQAMITEVLAILDDGMSLFANARTIIKTLDDLVHMRMPMAFIKEFRDAVIPEEACYMALVELVPQATKLHEWQILPNYYDIDIALVDSHPVRTDCGIAPTGTIRSKFGIYLDFDMTIPLATQTIL